MLIPSEAFDKLSKSRDNGRNETGSWSPGRESHVPVLQRPGLQSDDLLSPDNPINAYKIDINSMIRKRFNQRAESYRRHLA